MKNRRNLLDKFINTYFDLNFFTVNWIDDFIVTLEDSNNNQIVLFAIDDKTIATSIEGAKYLTYQLTNGIDGKEFFRVI